MKTRIPTPIATLLCAVLIVSGCGRENSENLLASAKEYLAKKDDKAAVIQLKNVLQDKPDSAEARFLLGRALLQGGDAKAAAIELQKALDLKYPAEQAVPLLAQALVAAYDHRAVLAKFADASLPQPQANADLKVAVATAHAGKGERDKARAALQAALRAVPGHAAALVLEARLDAAAGKPDQALATLDRVLAAEPADVPALQLKGDLLLYGRSDAAAAVAVYREALKSDPLNLNAHIGVMEALLMQHDTAAIKAQFDALRKTLPEQAPTLYYDALLAYLDKDYKRAGELVQKVLRGAPNNARTLQLAGAIEMENQTLVQAQDHLTKALQLAPELPGARRLLAQSYLRSRQPDKALAALEPLLAKGDGDAPTLSLAAEATAQSGDLKKAESYRLRAAKLRPDDTSSRVAVALSKSKTAGADAALAEVEKIADADGGAYADAVLVNAHLRRGDLDKALKALETVEKKQPGRADVAHLRGRIQLQRKDVADARRNFERALAADPTFMPAAASLALLDLADGKPDAAKKRFDALLAADPKNAHAMLASAALRARAGASAEEVATLLGNAVKANPNEVAPRLALINHYLARREDAKRGLAAAQDAATALPKSPELLDALGRAQLAAGERNQAINSFNKLIAMQPDSVQGYMRLAAIHAEAKEFDAARTDLKRALAAKPGLIAVQRVLIDLELRAGRPDDALAVARAVRRDNPSSPLGFMFEGGIELQKKNFAAAKEVFRAGLKQTGVTELAMKLHGALVAEQNRAEAAKFSSAWLADHPKDVRFLSYIGETEVAARRYQAAEGYFRRADQLSPGQPSILNNLAWILTQLKKPGAVDYAQKAAELTPESPTVLDTLAAALASENQLAKAVEVQKKAVALAPEALPLRLSLAKLYLQAGDKAAARVELDRLAKLDGKFAEQTEAVRLLQTL